MSEPVSDEATPIDLAAFVRLSLISYLEQFADAVSSDLAMLAIAERHGHEFDDPTANVLKAVARKRPNLTRDELLQLLREPVELLSSTVRDASIEGTEDALDRAFAVIEGLASRPELRDFLTELLRAASRPSANERLRTAVFVMLVALFEVVLGDLAAALAVSRVMDRDGGDEEVEVAETSQRARMDDKPADGRLAVIARDFELGSGRAHAVVELVARRNACVHANRRADERYMKRAGHVAVAGEDAALLSITEDYVHAAAATMVEAVASIVLDGLGQQEPGAGDPMAAAVGDLAFRLMEGNQLALAFQLSTWCVAQDVGQSHLRASLRVNHWLIQRRADSGQEWLEGVRAWDAVAAGPEFELARLVLLGELPSARALLAKLDSEGRVARDQLAQEPVFFPLFA